MTYLSSPPQVIQPPGLFQISAADGDPLPVPQFDFILKLRDIAHIDQKALVHPKKVLRLQPLFKIIQLFGRFLDLRGGGEVDFHLSLLALHIDDVEERELLLAVPLELDRLFLKPF